MAASTKYLIQFKGSDDADFIPAAMPAELDTMPNYTRQDFIEHAKHYTKQAHEVRALESADGGRTWRVLKHWRWTLTES